MLSLYFHCQLNNGVVFWSLPIHAFVHKEDFIKPDNNEDKLLSNLQYWNCQSSDISVTTFAYLQNYRVECFNRNKEWMWGTYITTIDDFYSNLNSLNLGYGDDPDKKCFHLIKLDNGFYCVYPNNFLRWHNLNFCDVYNDTNSPKYKAIQKTWNAEHISK